MEKIKKKFLEQKNKISDINEHIDTLYDYAKKCKHVTEMGVRQVSSTWPLLYSNPTKMISYDIVKDINVDEVINLSNEYGVEYQFIESDVLKIEIEPTELLFIDTLHTYNQLYKELELHSDNVSKYIILHDTVSFSEKDEQIYQHASEEIKKTEKTKLGIKNAMLDFLLTEKGKNWVILQEFTNNNGLTILERIK